MFEFNIDLITGVMLGIEFPPVDEITDENDNDLQFAMVIDLFILRFGLFKWKEANLLQ